ncbi:uncharacterized protein LOC108910919 [Anoplophora glabripennis]|uniref:uncharacterized protein LOC108910919 n=1 Tax=Anoplophora glabripennis TaxID=217634 RepID=UPI0008746529|nr:uncharacterized protein LOC108910919 [Anoplophora glabripennis]
MKYFVLLAIVVTVVAAVPVDVVEDEEGQQYYLVPVSREKRGTQWGLSGTGATVGHSGTIANSGGHRLDGGAYAGKNFGSHGARPDQVGGRLDYSHGSRTSAFASADHARHYGTDVNAGVRHNVYQNKNFGVDVTGQYGRHYGGPSGTGRASSGVGVVGHGTF